MPENGETLLLENDRQRLRVTPARGGGWLAWTVRDPGAGERSAAWLDLMPDARDPANGLVWCNWMMIPYSNRITEGRFSFEGRDYRLPRAEENAIHGDTRSRPWRVAERTAETLHLVYESREHPDAEWPWPIGAACRLRLEAETLVAEMELVNRGDTTMPGGFGFHPYFRRWLRREGEPVLLAAPVEGIYPDAHGTHIPSGPPAPPPPELDFSKEAAVDSDRAFDYCAHGFPGRAGVRWPESGAALEMTCSPTLDHLVLYNPVPKPFFAVEPVSNATDGVNLLARGEPTHGIRPLAPGASLSGWMRLRPVFG